MAIESYHCWQFLEICGHVRTITVEIYGPWSLVHQCNIWSKVVDGGHLWFFHSFAGCCTYTIYIPYYILYILNVYKQPHTYLSGRLQWMGCPPTTTMMWRGKSQRISAKVSARWGWILLVRRCHCRRYIVGWPRKAVTGSSIPETISFNSADDVSSTRSSHFTAPSCCARN